MSKLFLTISIIVLLLPAAWLAIATSRASEQPQPRNGRIAFSTSAPEGEHIFSVDAQGGSPHTTHGLLVMYDQATPGLPTKIFTTRLDGKDKTVLVDNGARNEFPAWSPDGKRIAYSSTFGLSGRSQIWTMDADGGNQKQITNLAGAVVPSWSPDGTIVFIAASSGSANPQVWIMNADGDGQKALTSNDTHSTLASFSPDGSKIVFTRKHPDGHNFIYSMSADGTNVRRLTFSIPHSPDANAASWSPDGRKIAFFSGYEGSSAPPEPNHQQVWVMDADGSNRRQLTNCIDPCLASDNPAWSPDGALILYERGDNSGTSGTWIMNADGTNPRQLFSFNYGAGRLPWRPDRHLRRQRGLIALTLRDQNGKLQIFTITSDGRNKKQLTFDGENGRPDWSPDGRRITYMSSNKGRSWVAVMDADGSNQQLLVEGAAPDWSPDSKQIAFSRPHGPDDRQILQIWVTNADGSNIRRITQSNIVKIGPSWSPDGKQMVFVLIKNPGSQTDPRPEIGIVNSNGTNERILTTKNRINTDGRGTVCETAYDANAPAWSPVDNRIAFWSGIENQYGQIWIINSDRTGSKQLTEDCSHRNSDDPSWSPDGKKILFSTGRSGRNELWVMEADGSNEKRISDIDAFPFPGRASWQPVAALP